MDSSERRQKILIEDYIKAYFRKNQGMRLGEASVISNKVHGNNPRTPGTIQIYTDLDAGRHYMENPEEGRFIHLDVFHEPASLDPVYVARHIKKGIEKYFSILRDENITEYPKDAVAKYIKTLCQAIQIKTSGGQGTVYNLANRDTELVAEKERIPQSHVHLLFSIDPKYYNSILYIVDSVEQAILNQGYEIRRVESIKHCLKTSTEESDSGFGITLPGFNSPEAEMYRAAQNRLQIILDLASAFGNIENAALFLESMTSTKSIFLGSFARKHREGSLNQTLLELSNLNLIKKGKFTYVLTKEGQEIKEFIRAHQKELEAQVRKSIRRYQIVRHNYKSYRNSRLKSRKNRLTDHKKVVGLNEGMWVSDIAVPETIIKATARTFHGGTPPVRIKKEDLKVYGQKSFAPIDTCLAIDCSGSMVGEKIKAVTYLARHFLLTAKEKISVVTFQETIANVVVPFTKNYQKLDEGLASIEPNGLTPLAKGIYESVQHIKNKKARNPLLVLITDGIPNYPLWSTDAKKDALKAAELIAENKIRLVCIGVIPNEDFMAELARIGQGNLYVVDQLDKNSLLDVVTQEWAEYKYSR